MKPLLSVDISAEYAKGSPVLRNAAFEIAHGEVLGLIGQSGSGKTSVSLAILRLLNMRGGTATGTVLFNGRDLMAIKESELRSIRGREIGFVSQSPATALNPAMTLGAHLVETWHAHAKGKGDFRPLLESVSLPGDAAFQKRYPGQLSIGQGQRFLIALGILHRPALLIADEPTSALDVITQAEILNLFATLKMAILYISHDLLSVANLCQRVAILHQGRIVETGPVDRIFLQPGHPYTRALVEAIPMPRYLFNLASKG